jgi:hypothetical protein
LEEQLPAVHPIRGSLVVYAYSGNSSLTYVFSPLATHPFVRARFSQEKAELIFKILTATGSGYPIGVERSVEKKVTNCDFKPKEVRGVCVRCARDKSRWNRLNTPIAFLVKTDEGITQITNSSRHRVFPLLSWRLTVDFSTDLPIYTYVMSHGESRTLL